MSYTINVGLDEATMRFFVKSSDIPGLNVEADTFDEIVDITSDVLPELIGERAKGSKLLFQREVVFSG